MNSKVMTKYFKNSPIPVQEGWGTALTQLGVVLGLPLFLANPVAGAVSTGVFALINGKLSSKAQSAMNKILSNQKVKAYITAECNKAFKAVQAKYGKGYTVSKKVGSSPITTKDLTTKGEMKHAGMKNITHDATIGEYHLAVYGDTDHINAMNVVFSVRNNKTGDVTYGLHAIPAPTRDDIKKMGFREED